MPKSVEKIYRESFGHVLAALVRKFGAEKLDELEEAVQEAFTKALKNWPDNQPADPEAWLTVVAKNHFLNRIDRKKTSRDREADVQDHLEAISDLNTGQVENPVYAAEIADNQLRMLFLCCHPELPNQLAVPFTLWALCGLTTAELARAFFVSQAAMEKRLSRAKKTLQSLTPNFDIPPAVEVQERAMRVCKVLYLLFNEGYTPKGSKEPLRADFCREALRLGEVLLQTPALPRDETHALLALFYLQFSRHIARLDPDGDLIELAHQDRSKWDQGAIRRGMYHLQKSSGGEFANIFHLEAMIASCHALAKTFAQTNWEKITSLYDLLYRINSTPVVAFNRAIAMGYGQGPAVGIRALKTCALDKTMATHFPLQVALAEFHRLAGDHKEASAALNAAEGLARDVVDRRIIAKKRADLG